MHILVLPKLVLKEPIKFLLAIHLHFIIHHFFSAEYAPVQDPVTGEWYANPMGMSIEETRELFLAVEPGGDHPSDSNTNGVSQEDEDSWNSTDASEHPSPSDNN